MNSEQLISGRKTRLSRNLRKVLLAVGLCTFPYVSVVSLMAQSRNAAEIKGTVRDESGAVIPRVSVTARNTATGQTVQGTTNGNGIYDFPYVPPGPYTVTFVKESFKEITKTNLVLTVDLVTVDATLQVGSTATDVTVDASSVPLLQTESPDVGATLTPAVLSAMPNVGGMWTMTQLLPGVTAVRIWGAPQAQAGGYQTYAGFYGSEMNEVSVQMNGSEQTTFSAHDSGRLYQPVDSISEVNVSTGLFGADTGNGTSTVNFNIKGGTNQFHGSAWEMLQNTAFEAKPYGSTTTPVLHWNRFGYTIGGPVIRNKLFFFQSLELRRTPGASLSYYVVPENSVRGIGTPNGAAVFDPANYGVIYDPATQATVNGATVRQPFPNNSIPSSRFNGLSYAIMQYYPTANQPFRNGSNYAFGSTSPTNTTFSDYRADYEVTTTNRISASGEYGSLWYQTPSPANPPGYFDWAFAQPTIRGQITDAWTISPSLLNEARFGLARADSNITSSDTNVADKLGLQNVPYDVFPHVSISGGARSPYGVNSDNWGGTLDHVYDLSDSVSWLRGKHSFKFGGEAFRGSAVSIPAISSGSWGFNGNATANPNINTATGIANPVGGSGLADFILGAVDHWSNTVPITPVITGWNLQFYGQDSWKVKPNLTVTLGLRALYQAGMKEAHGWYSNFDPSLINPATNTSGAVGYGSVNLGNSMEDNRWLFQPRAGVAWSPKTNWVFRAGYGLYNVPWSTSVYTSGIGNGYSAFGSLTQPAGDFTPVMSFNDPSPDLTHPTNADLTPALLNGQHVTYLPKNTPTTYREQYMAGVQHVIAGYLIDVSYIGAVTKNKLFLTDYTQIPTTELGTPVHPYSQYSGVTYLLRNGYGNYNALQIQSKKQFGNGFLYQVTYNYSKTMDTGSTSGNETLSMDTYQNAYDPSANYGPAANDMRHMLNGGVVYELPFGHGKRFLNQGRLLDGIVGGWQVASVFQWHAGIPFTPTVAGQLFSASGMYSGTWYPNRVGSGKAEQPTLGQFFNPNDFTIPANNTLGNSGRNVVYGPRYSDVDLSVAKSFRISRLGDGATFELKADASNALNHPTWGQPNGGIYATPELNQANGAGSISSFGAMRNLQLEAHLRF